MRRLLTFACEGDTLVATLDEAAHSTGLLIVSGGNEVRAGAHRGMALLAGRIAAAGHPVFRFDRRGVGDSGGQNRGWSCSAPDLVAAAAVFRREQPQMTHIVALGNCDAATALALFGQQAGLSHAVLTNPWLADSDDALPHASAIRARYTSRAADPRQWLRLLTGRIDLGKLAHGLAKLARSRKRLGSPVTERMRHAMRDQARDLTVVLAKGDATAQAFDAAMRGGAMEGRKVVRLPTASHSFHPADAEAALIETVLAALR